MPLHESCIILNSLVEAEEPRKTAASQRPHRGCTVDADRLCIHTGLSHHIKASSCGGWRGHGEGEGEGKE